MNEKLIGEDTIKKILKFEQALIEMMKKDNSMLRDSNNPLASLYISMVYGFSNHLPYSIDIEQPEYVPADFLNMEPQDIETNEWFKWSDRRNLFNYMVSWSDTFKSGMLLQVCSVFQKMILKEFPNDYVLTENEYISWGIDHMTKDEEYNRCFFETLKTLPDYYNKLINAENNELRRNVLEEFYSEIMQKISSKFGGFIETQRIGDVISTVHSVKPTIPIQPSKDVSMRVNWDHITYFDGIASATEYIKNEQLKYYNKPSGSKKLVKESKKIIE